MTGEMDLEKLKAYAKLVFGALGGAMTATMIHLGDRLGLYRALADGEALTSAELAARTGCAERWVREWLFQQGAARVLEYRDGGRGAGVAVLEMAKAFPRSAFHGWDVSEHALARAEENRRAAGAPNVTFHDARREPLPADARFALVTTFDCLHDMTDPAGTMRHIRAAIRPDGVWLVCDIKARESYEENVEKNPMAAMMYGTSVLTCMSSALSEPGGAGLGTL